MPWIPSPCSLFSPCLFTCRWQESDQWWMAKVNTVSLLRSVTDTAKQRRPRPSEAAANRDGARHRKRVRSRTAPPGNGANLKKGKENHQADRVHETAGYRLNALALNLEKLFKYSDYCSTQTASGISRARAARNTQSDQKTSHTARNNKRAECHGQTVPCLRCHGTEA